MFYCLVLKTRLKVVSVLFKSFFRDRGIDSQRQKVTGLFDKEVLIVTVFLDLFTDTSNPIRAAPLDMAVC